MSEINDLGKKVTVLLGASIMLVVSVDAAASVCRASPSEALAAIRVVAKSGQTSIGETRLDGQGRIHLAQFSDVWSKWSKEFSDTKPS